MDFDFAQVSQLLENMSPEEMDNLQQMAQSLFASSGGDSHNEPDGHSGEAEGSAYADTTRGSPAGGGFNMPPELLAKLAQLMGQMNRRDPRTDLILALKPHLSEHRRQRADQAAQMMKMLELLPTLQEALR